MPADEVAAHGDEHGVHAGKLLVQLAAYGALAGDGLGLVVGVHDLRAVLGCAVLAGGVGVGVVVAGDGDLRAVGAQPGHLHR